MKTLAPFFVSASLALTQAALAGDMGHQEIVLRGYVGNTCALPNPVVSGTTITSGVYTIDPFVGPLGTHEGTVITFTFPGASCNYTARLGLQSVGQGMKPSSSANPPGFANFVNYKAIAKWGDTGAGGLTTTLDTAAGTKGDNNGISAGPLAGDLTVTVKTAASTLPLIATGSPYIDTLVVQIGQAL